MTDMSWYYDARRLQSATVRFFLLNLSTIHVNIIDLALPNTPYLNSDTSECDCSFSSDHAVLKLNLPKMIPRLIYDFKRTFVNGLINDLCDTETFRNGS